MENGLVTGTPGFAAAALYILFGLLVMATIIVSQARARQNPH